MNLPRRSILGATLCSALALEGGCASDPETVGMVDDGGGAGAGTNDPDPDAGPSGSEANSGEGSTSDPSTSDPSTSEGGETSADDAGPEDTGPMSSDPECTVDADCVVVDDCCACDAVPVGEVPEDCPWACEVPSCTGAGLEGVTAACRMGRCEFAPLQCAPDAQVACAMPPPQCTGGRLARAFDGCWGPCIDPYLCASVPACDETCPDGWFCLVGQGGAIRPHCEPLPFACEGEIDCDCIAPFFDEVCPSSCAELNSTTILCEDGG